MQETSAPLVVDVRAAQVAVPEPDLQSWAADHSVFVSSLITGMRDQRAAVRAAIESLGAIPVMFEYDLGAQDIDSARAYTEGVMTSDIYVGIFGTRYGIPLASRYSATEAEYREAEARGLRMALFVQEGADFDGRQSDFVAGMRNAYTTSPWSDSADLGARVKMRLTQIAAEEIAPWVRLGDLVFRVREIRTSANEIVVVADIRTPSIHSALQDFADRRTGALAFAAPGTVTEVQFVALETQTQSTTSHRDSIRLRVAAQQHRAQPMSLTSNGRTWSAEELEGAALSDALFGTTLSPQGWGVSRMADPLGALRGQGLPESVLRPVARLLVTETLITNGMAAMVDSFRLSPSASGARGLSISWTPPKRYSNVAAGPARSVEGTIRDL